MAIGGEHLFITTILQLPIVRESVVSETFLERTFIHL